MVMTFLSDADKDYVGQKCPVLTQANQGDPLFHFPFQRHALSLEVVAYFESCKSKFPVVKNPMEDLCADLENNCELWPVFESCCEDTDVVRQGH